jgi:hypothetical protein
MTLAFEYLGVCTENETLMEDVYKTEQAIHTLMSVGYILGVRSLKDFENQYRNTFTPKSERDISLLCNHFIIRRNFNMKYNLWKKRL